MNKIRKRLKQVDPEIYSLIKKENKRIKNTIQLIAAENISSKAVIETLGTILNDKTTEWFSKNRFHGWCQNINIIEDIAINRAKKVFKAKYANVQPHSWSQSNQIVLLSCLNIWDKILSLSLDDWWHLTHGASVSITSKLFNVKNYKVDKKSFLLNYNEIEKQAIKEKPKLIICWASAYAREINFKKFREIANKVGALLLADISHISGIISAWLHQSPIDYAHFTTTSTYKPGWPRWWLILMWKDFEKISKKTWKFLRQDIQKSTFPSFQWTPSLNNIAAKAVLFKEMLWKKYKNIQTNIIENSKVLAEEMKKKWYFVLTGWSDNHMVLIDISKKWITWYIAQYVLEDCWIITNKNKIPYDKKSATIASGLRLWTPVITRLGLWKQDMKKIANMIDRVLMNVKVINEKEYKFDENIKKDILKEVKELSSKYKFL